MDFLDRRVVVLAIFTTCAALVAIVVLNRQNKLRRLPSIIAAKAAQVLMLNSSVYELYNPPSTPSMEVVFFHGFQHGDYEDAHISTWKSGDGSSIWPQTWLAEKFCDARILTISYNDSLVKSCQGGIFDMYLLGENLVSDLLGANIGQQRCPVVLVGHSFGGLVVKQVCAHAASKTGGLKGNSESSFKLTAFLENIKGIFFYSTPHHGIKDIRAAEHFVAKGPLLDCVKTLSTQTARLNSDFDILWGQDGKYKTWQIAGLCESLPTKWGRSHDLVFVQEASSRYGASFNVVEGADHISVCRPAGETSRSFSALANFLERVAPDVKATVHGLPNYPSALEKRAFAIQQKLGVSPVLGIVGMGGIGKTTLAKQLFNTLSQQFEYTCFVDNVKDMRIHELNDWVLNHFLRNGTRLEQNSFKWSDLEKKKALITMDDVNDELQLKILPRLNKLGNGSLLIFTTRDQGVLDTFPNCVIYDVEFLNFEEAKKLFCQHAFEQEEIPESLVKMNQRLGGIVENVIRKCDGLPLTLEVMGSYLRKHKTDATVWKQTLDKLGKAQAVTGLRDDRVWASLRISYDALSDEERGMFNEAGTYFFQQRLERALAAWRTTYEYSESCWANLLRTSMVKEISRTSDYVIKAGIEYKEGLEYKEVWVHEQEISMTSKHSIGGSWGANKYREGIEYKEVWVHEHLRDLAKKEAKGAVNLFHANAVEADTTMLQLSLKKGCPKLPLESLDKLENLKYLELDEVWPLGLSSNLSRKLRLLKWTLTETRERRNPPPFPFNLEGMNDLAVLELEWSEIPEDILKTLEKLSNLRILSLCSKSWWPAPARLPDNFGHLPHLKRLVLKSLDMAALPQSFGNLSALEYLQMSSVIGVELPESFGNLSSLVTLLFDECKDLASLPKSFGNLSSLATLAFGSCDKLASLPESFGKLPCLTTLVFDRCTTLASLPESLGCLSSLVLLRIRYCPALKSPDLSTELRRFERHKILRSLTSLYLHGCGSLQRLPACFEVLPSLENLELSYCGKLRMLPETLGEWKALKKLTISKAGILEVLPDSFGNLTALTVLKLEKCGNLKRLPAFGNLSALQEISFSDCTRLHRLPNNFGQLSALKELLIQNCPYLEELSDDFGNLTALTFLDLYTLGLKRLPASFGNLSALRELRLESCRQVRRLPDNFSQLRSLEKLVIGHGCGLEALSDGFGNLPALTYLHLQCECLTRLPASFGNLSALQELQLEDCHLLQRLPDNFGRLRALQKLTIDRADRLVALSANFGNLSALQEIMFSDCTRLHRLPNNFGQLSALKKLVIKNCPYLEELSDDFGNLPALTYLQLKGKGLERLPASFGNLSALQELQLEECHLLQRLPDNFGRLRALQKLTIYGADRLVALSDDFGNLPALTYLHLQCECLERLPASFGNLSALQELQLQECDQLQRLPANFGALRALQKLKINRVHQLVALSDDFGNLASLTDLDLCCCSRLERLPETFGNLSALQVLRFDSCNTLQRLPDNFGELSALEKLSFIVFETDQLEALPDSFGNLSALKDFNLMAKVLQRFPKSIGQQLHALRRLFVCAPMLSSLPEELGNLSSLEYLTFLECESLQTLPDSLGRISSLRTLVLQNCSGLRSLPDSLGDHFVSRSHGDGSSGTDTRTPVGEQSSEGEASMERFCVYVNGSPFLDDSVMEGLGWLECDVGDDFEGDDIFLEFVDLSTGKLYQRKRLYPAESNQRGS